MSQQQQQQQQQQPPQVQPPLLFHQLVGMVHIYRRLFLCSIILPILVIVVPVLLRIFYQVLTLCIGRSDDRYMLSTIITTIVLTHIISTKFHSLQTYVHSLTTSINNQQNKSATLPDSNEAVAIGESLESTSTKQTPPPPPVPNDEVDDTSKISMTEQESSKENINSDSMNVKSKMRVTFLQDVVVDDEEEEEEDENHHTIGGSHSKYNKTPLQESKKSNHHNSNHNITDTGSVITVEKAFATTAATTITVPTTTMTTPKNKSYVTPVKVKLHHQQQQLLLLQETALQTNIDSDSNSSSSSSSIRTTIYVSSIVFVLVCTLTRYITISGNSGTGSGNDNTDSNSSSSSSQHHTTNDSIIIVPSFITTLRCSICMIVYGIMISLRFFGPTSIMRLSIFPLLSNPYDRSIQNWFFHLRKTLIYHSYPTMNIGIVRGEGFKEFSGRRYERPTIYATMQHMVVSLIASIIVAYVGIFPYTTVSDQNDDVRLYVRSIHMASCILTTFGSIITILDGTAHEINPYLYTNPNKDVWFRVLCSNISSRVLYTAMIVPGLSIILTWYMIRLDVALSFTNYLLLFVQLLRNCVCMSMYLYMYDEMIRTSLFYPRLNLSNMIHQLADDTSSALSRLGVILNSVLCDPLLVQQIVDRSYSITAGSTYGFEKEELHSSEKLMKQMAHVLLSPIDCYVNTPSEAPLEEDVLRIITLEAFGGGSGNQKATMSERHQNLIDEWINRPTSRYTPSKTVVEPLSSALVRGLCVYVGGNGEAFTMISTQTPLSSSSDNQRQLCKFSLAAFCSLELCLVAMGRCIIRSLTSSVNGHTISDWKRSHLSIQIPSALTAIYKLRRGVVQYSRLVNQDFTGSNHDVTGTTKIGVHMAKEHEQIVRVCDSVALSILQSMKNLHGSGRIDITLLDRDCQEWKNRLVVQSTDKE